MARKVFFLTLVLAAGIAMPSCEEEDVDRDATDARDDPQCPSSAPSQGSSCEGYQGLNCYYDTASCGPHTLSCICYTGTWNCAYPDCDGRTDTVVPDVSEEVDEDLEEDMTEMEP